MMKFEFPAGRTDICRAVATMLNTIADGTTQAAASNIVKNVTAAEQKRIGKEPAPTLDDIDPADCATNEYEEVVVDALLSEDEGAAFSIEDVKDFGNNLRFVYENLSDGLASLSTVAEILADNGGVAQTLSDTGLIRTTLNQSTVAKVDTNGVAFCDKHCATAADPFYGAGKMKGQWKKKRGVDQPVYDAWYADQLPPSDQTPIDTTAAFGGQTTTDESAPANLGELMAWVAAQQTAGNVTKEQVTAAYTQCGVNDISALFTATPEAQQSYIAAIYGVLSA